ncbi:MAG: peptidylprolyl isomerase [Planctomycetota bacterium]
MPPSGQRSIRFWGILRGANVTLGVFKPHRLGLESLEPRLAMCSAHESTNSAGELTSPSTGSCSAVVSPVATSFGGSGTTSLGDAGASTGTGVVFGPLAAPSVMLGATSSTNGGSLVGGALNMAAEGETQPLATDLMALARAISASGTKFYGAAWCTFCTQQKELFADAQYYLPFVEATNPDRTLNEAGTAAGITSFPTWVFPDGSRETGVQTLATLAARSGVSVTTSNAPELLPITDQWIYAGSPQWIALDGFDPNFDALTYTVISDNPGLLTTQVSQANRSLVVDVKSWGKMTFQLFDNIVPRITERIVSQAEVGFYDKTSTNNSIVSQVIKDAKQSYFRLGDPAGNGTSVSGLGPIADQFDVRLQHNSAGLLSLAKTADDTGDVQFFVLGEPVRQFDFQYPIFGMLTEGEKVRRAINLTATNNGKPSADILVNSIDVVRDGENALLMLSAADGKFGEANVTVTVRDPGGRSAQRTFKVTVLPDPTNSGPFLTETRSVMTSPGVAVSLQLNAVDADGDPVRYEASLEDPTKGQINVNATTGQVTVTPIAGFTGDLRVKVGVRAPPDYPNDTFDPVDTQTLIIKVRANPTYWQNLDLPADVDQDGVVVPRDALLVINELNARALSTSSGAMKFERPTATTGFFYFDTSGDNLVTPVDALRVVNRLNGVLQPGEGEAARVIESSVEGELVSSVEASRSVGASGVFVASGVIEPLVASRFERAAGIAGGGYCVRDTGTLGGPPEINASTPADENRVKELDAGRLFDAIFSEIGAIG